MMNKIEKLIYDVAIDEIDSFEAYYKNVILRNNNVIIPYINLGISNHEINPTSKLHYLSFAYMVFIDVTYLRVFLKDPYLIFDSTSHKQCFHFGGNYLDYDKKVFNDLTIGCDYCFLQMLDFSEIREEMWIPFTTSNFIKNMDTTLIEKFFAHTYIPENIEQLIK